MKRLVTDDPRYIDSYSINSLINKIDEISDNEIELSWNSFGGSVWDGWQFADFLKTTDKKINARVTGIAASMGATLLAYFDKVVGTKQADVMIHSVYTSVDSLTDRSNDELYKVLAAKIDEAKFKEIVGQSLKDVMNLKGEERRNVWISGQQAFDIGLFDELIDLQPEEATLKNSLISEMNLTYPVQHETTRNWQCRRRRNLKKYLINRHRIGKMTHG